MNYKSVDDRRSELIAAAVSLGIREGLASVTTRGVAKEAGLPLGAVHYCFPNKDRLLVAMGRQLTRGWITAVGDALDVARKVQLDWDEMVLIMVKALLSQVKQYRKQMLLILELSVLSARNEQLSEVARHHAQMSRDMVEYWVAELYASTQNKGSIPVKTISSMALAVCDGAEFSWVLDGDDERYVATFRMFLDLLKMLAVPKVAESAAKAVS